MRHKPLGAQLGDTLDRWGRTKWAVQLLVTDRQMVETVSATCFRFDSNDQPVEGFHSEEVGPFDDLRLLVQHCLLESALACLEPWEMHEPTLPFDPHTA